MTFRNIPLKSALIEKRVDRDSEGEINGHGEKECLPTEYQYEFEELREKGWWERDSPEIS